MIKNHPPTQFLADYSAGALSLAPAISVTTHLQFCDQCREAVSGLNALGGELLNDCEGIEISSSLLAETLDRLDAPMESAATSPSAQGDTTALIDSDLANELPDYLHKFVGRSTLNWRSLSSSVSVAPITVGESDYELALHRIEAGGKTPVHDHQGTEVTVVLKGTFSDEQGMYHEGDFLIREAGDVHQPIAAQNESCVCLSVLSAPIKLTGIKQVLNPFMRFNPS
ncbi:MAG: ChrR family anti-sigma-E factor [Pseudomonadales bacterium]